VPKGSLQASLSVRAEFGPSEKQWARRAVQQATREGGTPKRAEIARATVEARNRFVSLADAAGEELGAAVGTIRDKFCATREGADPSTELPKLLDTSLSLTTVTSVAEAATFFRLRLDHPLIACLREAVDLHSTVRYPVPSAAGDRLLGKVIAQRALLLHCGTVHQGLLSVAQLSSLTRHIDRDLQLLRDAVRSMAHGSHEMRGALLAGFVRPLTLARIIAALHSLDMSRIRLFDSSINWFRVNHTDSRIDVALCTAVLRALPSWERADDVRDAARYLATRAVAEGATADEIHACWLACTRLGLQIPALSEAAHLNAAARGVIQPTVADVETKAPVAYTDVTMDYLRLVENGLVDPMSEELAEQRSNWENV
jgi:hypothetical protein